jgi:glucoamylase
MAVGARHEARRVLRYIAGHAGADGHWSQNMWLDGTPYWQGVQMGRNGAADSLVDLAARRRRD